MGKAAKLKNHERREARQTHTTGVQTFMERREEYPMVMVSLFVKNGVDEIAKIAKDIAGGGNCMAAADAAAHWLDAENRDRPEGAPDLGEVVIVHGYPVGTGGQVKNIRYAHAWVECDDMNGRRIVVDASNGKAKIMVREAYYDLAQLTEDHVRRYTLPIFIATAEVYDSLGPFWEYET